MTDIAPSNLQVLLAFINRFLPNTLVWAFGSRVKFTAKHASDLDLVALISDEQIMQFSLLKET